MADINELIARGPPSPDFTALSKIPDAYWAGLNQAYQQRNQDLFKNGMPEDLGVAARQAIQAGGVPAFEKLQPFLTLQGNIAQTNRENRVFGVDSPAPVISPSTSQNVQRSEPQNENPNPGPQRTIMGMVLARNNNEGQAREIADRISQATGIHPDQPLDRDTLPRVLQAAPGAFGAGPQVAQGPQGLNPSQPVTPAAAPQADPTLGGIVPSVFRGNYQAAMDYFSKIAGDRAVRGDKEGAKVAQDRADQIAKAVGQLRGSALDERKGVVEAAIKPVMAKLEISQQKADSIADGIMVSHDLLAQLDSKSGIFSGQWANQKLSLAKISRAVGLDIDADKITNTESFGALVGKKVAQTVKSFGSGTSITNQDREYAAKMEAGDIKLDETSMRRIINITDKINRGIIDKHNKQIDDLVRARPELAHLAPTLKVDMPPKYDRGNLGVLQEAKDAIARGADRDQVIQRLKDRGISPAGL